MKVISLNHMPLVRINAPEWYKREDWMRWLNQRNTENHPATWHTGGEPHEMSDVFFTWSGRFEGSDYEGDKSVRPSIPEDIWKEICKVCGQAGSGYMTHECLVWVSNLEE